MILQIAFDIDGCVVDLMSQFDRLIFQDGFCRKPHTTYQIETDPAMDHYQIWDYIRMCYEQYNHTPIFQGVSKLFQDLFGLSQEPIHFITARPKWAASYTYLLMDRICRVPYTISFADDRWNKVYFMNHIHYFVEDRASSAREIAAAGKHVFMPDRHYNQMPFHSGITRIQTFNDLYPYMNSFIQPIAPVRGANTGP